MTNVLPFRSLPSGAAGKLIPSRLRDARKVLRLTQEDLGDRVGVKRQAISAFERGDKKPDPATFVSLAQSLGQPIAFFTTRDAPDFGETSARFFRRFGPDTIRRNDAAHILGSWFVQLARFFDETVNYPAVDIPDYSGHISTDEDIDDIAENLRRHWGLGLGPISNVLALLETKGIIACRYEMTGENVEAFSFWNGPRPFIFLASEKEAGVRTRFDLAHELGHLVLHRDLEQSELEDKAVLKRIEREADRFAGAFLLPRHSFANEVFSPRLDAFVDLKRRWRVSIQAMIYRCGDLGLFDDAQILNLRKQISFRRWRTREPLDDPSVIPLEQPRVLGAALDLIMRSGRMNLDYLLATVPLSTDFIEVLCNLPAGRLRGRDQLSAETTLK
jgi:Zn-dependent peptidase ImmA (M78 family)/transcriptional regulator with XRE-family HTH domain